MEKKLRGDTAAGNEEQGGNSGEKNGEKTLENRTVRNLGKFNKHTSV